MPPQNALMNLGKVVGTVVATRKEPSMEGLKFMLVKHVDPEGKETGGQVVAVDEDSSRRRPVKTDHVL